MPGSLVVVNPNASQVRDADVRASLTRQLAGVLARRDGAAPDIVETTVAGEVGPLVESALAAGVASVVGVGGDGTLRDIAAALKGTSVPVGIVPAGTGNQVAAVLGIPRSLDRAADAFMSAVPRRIDLGEVDVHLEDGTEATELFTIGCGAGFDAELMATTPDELKQRIGAAAYFAQAAKLALRIESVPSRIDIDGDVIETGMSAALVGNMGQLVPGFLDLRLPIDPGDGLLDIIVVGARNPVYGLMGLADQLIRSDLGGESGSNSIRRRGRSVSIEPARPRPLEIDGDYVGVGHLSARVLPGALDILVPDR